MTVLAPIVGETLTDARGRSRAVVEAIVGDRVFIRHLDRFGHRRGAVFTLKLRFMSSRACGWQRDVTHPAANRP